MSKRTTKAEKDHMDKVAALGCIACQKIGYFGTPAEIHHISNQTMGKRASNYEVIPLCPIHHRHGKNAIHKSRKLFESEFGTEKELLNEVLSLI